MLAVFRSQDEREFRTPNRGYTILLEYSNASENVYSIVDITRFIKRERV